MSNSDSLNKKTWQRFKRNSSAMVGLAIIIVSLFIAIFAYQLSPDGTPDANEQVLELETHPPGFSISFLKLKRLNTADESRSWFQNFFFGKPNNYALLPVKKYEVKGDSIIAELYKGTGFASETKTFAISDFVASDYNCITCETAPISSITKKYWLGTDRFGRDILSRLIIGVRVSLFVGLVALIISLVIGVFLGAIAGYFRGWVDEAVMWLINVFWAIPTLLLAMGLYVGVGGLIDSKLLLIFIAVGLTMWVDVARLVRGQFILLREMEFVTAASSLGFSHFRTIFVHILPNTTGPIIVVACSNFASAILVESGLSFIGLGIQPPAPSWGGMLNEYRDFIDSDKAFLALAPGLAIMLLVLAFNLVGNGLRDALDVKGNAS
ncbi:MAG TPA: ABC transporter permease [Chitinophagales bacterium]